MPDDLIVVLDVGKTLAKLTLWTQEGALVARATHVNHHVQSGLYRALDTAGIDDWMAATLRGFATHGRVGAIMPVGHGAAAVLVRDGEIVTPPMDYEQPIPLADREEYDTGRDPFAHTGSPRLPDGLNLGAQLHYLERIVPGLLDGATQILPWPQYWAWRLCGVAASEVTSLGCHTDLWQPRGRQPSDLARARGWATHFAPLAEAGDVLGTLTPAWARRTGLPASVRVHCGLHDSNAALLAARGFPQIADNESTVLSTGTWFVAMRTPSDGGEPNIASLPEAHDCVVNVDAYGKLIPSARFMGGREIELLTGVDARRLDIEPDQPALLAEVADVVASGARVLPSWAPGTGPFPQHRGRWVAMPSSDLARRAAVSLYAALVADAALTLIGAAQRILVEGRFAEAELLVRAVASLRPNDAIYVSNAQNDVSFGALRLLNPQLQPPCALMRVQPLDIPILAYRDQWRHDTEATTHLAQPGQGIIGHESEVRS